MIAATQKQAVEATAAMAVTEDPIISAEDEALKRNTDCVYFLASPLTCKKGSECEYRHSEYARVNPRDCYYWLNGNCMNQKCGFRHPPLDGLLGTQVAVAPPGSSMSSSHINVTPTSYNQGVFHSSRTQAVPCIFFQKGLCIKGDRCTFLHGPITSIKAPQPAVTATATEPNPFKKTFGAVESSQSQKLSPTNVSKIGGVPPEDKPAPKVGAASVRIRPAIERRVPHQAGLDEELPQHKGTYTTSVVIGSSTGRCNRLNQLHVTDEPSFQAGKETDELFKESSPGFDVLVDDEVGDPDFYHGEDQHGGARVHNGMGVNEYDIGHHEAFHDRRGYDSFDHVQGNYGWDQQTASSERKPLGPSTLERRGYSRADSPVEESDLRHRLSKHRRVNGLRSVVNKDHTLENHEGEQNYRSSQRDSHNLSSNESSLSSRLRGRIKLPGRSLANGTDSHSEREIDRGRSWDRLSPGKPQTASHQGSLLDRIKGRVEGEYDNKEGPRFGGSRIRREIMNERNADFAAPKRLAELTTDNKERLMLGKRKSIDDFQLTEGDISFKGPMPLSEILKRKRQSEPAASGSDIASVRKDVNRKQGKESLNGVSINTVVSTSTEESNKKEESKSSSADIGTTEVAHGESSQLNIREHESEDGIIGDVTTENHENEVDDQRDGDYYEEQGDEGDHNYEEGENADLEEQYVEEEEEGEDGDDFAKKLGVMFS